MIFTKKELQEAIGGKEIIDYLDKKGYIYMVIGSKERPLYVVEDKLKLKGRLEIEDIVKGFYCIEGSMVDRVVDSIMEIYNSEESINIKDLVAKDRALVDVLLQEDIVMYDYNNYNVSVRYSLLAKILEV